MKKAIEMNVFTKVLSAIMVYSLMLCLAVIPLFLIGMMIKWLFF